MTDDLPIATTYRGIGIYAAQPAKRVALVRAELDEITLISDLIELARIAGDASWAPETRRLAAAKAIAGLERATTRREAKPDLSIERIEASIAGLASQKWAHSSRYCSLLDAFCERAAPREQSVPEEPLADARALHST